MGEIGVGIFNFFLKIHNCIEVNGYGSLSSALTICHPYLSTDGGILSVLITVCFVTVPVASGKKCVLICIFYV